MVTALAIIHVIVTILLITLIMVQDPKGGGGGVFGAGGSNSVLGSTGAADFMTKLTRYVAVVFGVLCIAITLAIRPPKSGVFSKIPLPAEATAPVDAGKDVPAENKMEAPADNKAPSPVNPESKK